MSVRLSLGWLLPVGFAVTAAPALAQSNCGRPPCGTTQSVKGVAVAPGPDDFSLRGDMFQNSAITDLKMVNGFATVTVPFAIRVGASATRSAGLSAAASLQANATSSVFTTFYVNQNGTVSFDKALGSYTPVAQLADLGAQVIAPFYDNLMPGAGSGDGRLEMGDIVVQVGQADPFPNGGGYNEADLRDAVRITWYGVNDGPLSAAGVVQAPVLAQLLIAADRDGLTSFEFRYGDAGSRVPSQLGYTSLAGFALGNTQVNFTGPYVGARPTFFEFYQDQYVGQFGTPILAASGVPEPATWTAMILGFGLAGAALRRRRTPVTASA